MQSLFRKCLLAVLFFSMAIPVNAQRGQKKAKRDSLVLVCPLLDAFYPPAEKQAYEMGAEELKMILSSKTDTIAKAVMSGKVTTIQRDEEGKWELVFYHDDYWFWYTGLDKVNVVKNQPLKAGDTIGLLLPGSKLELRIYDFETPVDPKKYLQCVRP